MSSAIGNKKQEEKIARMAAVVLQHAPEANLLSVKGAFRFGISKALEINGFESWQQVADKPAVQRKKFFDSVLDNAAPHLQKVGVDASALQKIKAILKQENETFMKAMGKGVQLH